MTSLTLHPGVVCQNVLRNMLVDRLRTEKSGNAGAPVLSVASQDATRRWWNRATAPLPSAFCLLPCFAFCLLTFIATAAQADKPIDGRTPPPGYTPPTLIGVQGEGKGPRVRPISFPAADEPWVRVRSVHFIVLSSATDKRTRAMVEGLETLAAALTKLAPSIAAPSATPTRVLVFTRHREVQPYFDYLLNRDSAHVTGLFVTQKNAGSMIIEAEDGTLPSDRTPFHELVHSLLTHGKKRPPLWLDEGLAEYFGSASLRRGSLFIGEPVRAHVEVLRREKHLPLAEVFGAGTASDDYNLTASQRLFYAESWAAVDALMRASGPQQERFYDFIRDVESGTTVDAALQAHFGLTVASLEKTLRAYGHSLRSTSGTSLPVPDVDTSMTMARLERDDLLYELGAFLRALNPESPEATRHFAAALEINPKHAHALAALGRYEESIAAGPNDPEVYLTYAESLLGTQIGPLAEANPEEEKEAAAFRKARQLAAKALTLHGDEARARGDFGVSFLLEQDSDLGPGIEALQSAHALAPERNDFAVHLFAFLRRSGDHAEPLLAQLLAAHNMQLTFAARAIVVRTELARANVLAHNGQLDGAAKMIRELAGNTDDADARRDLLRQADELARVAETNRQITAFNEAIAQVNAGQYAAARKTLTTLLATATDPGVIRDAQKLLKELGGRPYRK